MNYIVKLTEEQETFLDIYLAVRPLRKEHTRDIYPHLIVNNFINSMMKNRREAFKERFEVGDLQKSPRPEGGAYLLWEESLKQLQKPKKP